MIELNGEPTSVAPGTTLRELLLLLGRNPDGRGVAVARNGEVVPRSAWEATAVGEGDRVEVLTAVQGG